MEFMNFISRPGKSWNLIVANLSVLDSQEKFEVFFDRLLSAVDKAKAISRILVNA